MKNLENYSYIELTSKELEELNGGFLATAFTVLGGALAITYYAGYGIGYYLNH